jgi:hypothetical protein
LKTAVSYRTEISVPSPAANVVMESSSPARTAMETTLAAILLRASLGAQLYATMQMMPAAQAVNLQLPEPSAAPARESAIRKKHAPVEAALVPQMTSSLMVKPVAMVPAWHAPAVSVRVATFNAPR